MNEFEKDEILEEEENVSPETEENEERPDTQAEAEETTGRDKLSEELENIRDMFQEELDKASQAEEYPDGIVIQELEDVEFEDEDEEEISDAELCECCGENPRSEEYGEDYPYCEECRNLMKKYPLRAGSIFMTILMVVVFAASLYLSYPYMNDALTVADASANYTSGRVMSALMSYNAYFNGGRNEEAISKRAFNEIIEGYTRTGYHNDAANLINTYYNENDLKKPWNKKYADVVKEATVLTETYQAVSAVTNDALYGEDYDYDKVMADLDALKEANPVEEGTSQVTTKYNEVFIDYYKYVIMSIHGESFESQFEALKSIDAIGAGYEWIYLSNYCAIAAKCGDEAAVNDSFDRLTQLNIQDTNAYIAKANYYRYLDEPDTDKMIEICEKAAESASSSDLAYKHALAIAYILKGEGALALEEITALFNSGAYTLQNCNLYALCGLYTGDEAIYDEMVTLLAGYGYEISDLVTQYKDGKITIEEVLKDKGGDI